MNSTQTSHPTEPTQHRHLRRALHRALDTLGWVTAAGVLTLLLSTGCVGLPRTLGESTATATAKAGNTQNTDSDPNSASAQATDPTTGATAGTSTTVSSTGAGLGGSIAVAVNVDGSDTQGTATGEQTNCFVATEAYDPYLFLSQDYQIRKNCLAPAGGLQIKASVSLQKNNEALIEFLNGEASADCDDPNITNTGLPPFQVGIPGVIFGTNRFSTFPSVVFLQPGDMLKLISNLEVQADLPSGETGDIKVSANVSPSFDYGVIPTSCNRVCTDNADCPADHPICENNACHSLSFKIDNPTVTTTPATLTPGQPFSFNIQFDVKQGTLQPENVTISILKDAFTWNGVSAVNLGAGGFTIGPFSRLVLTTMNPNVLYVPVDGNAVHNPGVDVTITVAEDPSDPSRFIIDIDIPDGGEGDPAINLIPVNTTVNLQVFFGFFTPGPANTGTIVVNGVSVDADGDGPLFQPLEFNLEYTGGVFIFCGNGVIDLVEECDDGGRVDGDGCSATCRIEPTEPVCGDGLKAASEECDDGNIIDGDGCSATCDREPGFLCVFETGRPSFCHPICGDGLTVRDEECDDGNTLDGDGCSSVCLEESCGDGALQPGLGEECDDGNTLDGDGCSATCGEEPGFLCVNETGERSLCRSICGDGLRRGSEQCDDGNTKSFDGCSFNCMLEEGYSCTEQPSGCTPICGDGLSVGGEDCDDNNATADDGCSATCKVEPGWTCTTTAGQPSVCTPICTPEPEVCGNDIDEDCDGADLPCPVIPFNDVNGNLAPRPDPNEDKVAVQAIVPLTGAAVQTVSPAPGIPFDPLTEGATLRLEQAGNAVVSVQFPPGEGWKVNKKGTTWSFKDKKDGSLGDPSKDTVSVQCNIKKQICSVKVNVKETELGAVSAGEITTTVVIGDDHFQKTQMWREKGKGKKLKLVTP